MPDTIVLGWPQLPTKMATKLKIEKRGMIFFKSSPLKLLSQSQPNFAEIKKQWTIEEISIFSNSSHLEWRSGLSDTILKWDYPRTIPGKFGLIWFYQL
jgi:hypothetical protein